MREAIRGFVTLGVIFGLALGGLSGCGDDTGPDTGQVDVEEPDTDEPDTEEVEEDTGPECPVQEFEVAVVSNAPGTSDELLEGNAPLTLDLRCQVKGEECADMYYKWDFDTGAAASQPEQLGFTYHVANDYNVCCQAWRQDGLGSVVEACQLVRVKDSAELSITSPKINSQAEVAPGQCVDVTFNMRNNGGKIDDPFDVSCVLSPIPHQNWDDAPDQHIPVWTYSQEGMGNGLFVTQEVSFTNEEMCVPEDVTEGQFFLLCKADSGDVVNESNKGDNSKFATTFITIDNTQSQTVDLSIEELAIPDDQLFPKNWNDKLSYKLTIKNTGDAEAEQFKYRLNLCDGNHENCAQIDEKPIFGIDPEASLDIVLSYSIPEGTENGSYCLTAELDIDDQIEESDEENNFAKSSSCFDVEFEELKGTDLGIIAMNCTPTDAVWNGNITVNMTVANGGNVTTPDWDYEIYLSSNPAPTPATSWLLCKGNDCKGKPGIEASQQVDVKTVVKVPGDIPINEFWCIVKIDPNDDVEELDEGNNYAKNEKKVGVTSKAYTDVYVETVTFTPGSKAQHAGKDIKVTYILGNQDKSTAAGVEVCVVLSQDKKTSFSEVNSGKDIVLGKRIEDAIEGNTEVSPVPTDKYTLPLALHHTIGTYNIGVLADCANTLGSDTQKGNNSAFASSQLTVISPQGGCFEDDFEPNGTLELAQELPEGLTEGLGGCNDDDWYQIKVPVGNTLVVDVTAEATLSLEDVPWDLDVDLYGPDELIADTSAKTGPSDQVLAFVVPAEAYYYLRVKPKKKGNEAHYSVNVQFKPPVEGIDLFPAKVKAAPAETFSGGALYLNWKLINLGKTPAGAFDVKVFMSTDETLGEEDIEVGTVSLTGHEPTSTVQRDDALILPTDIPGGTYNVILQVDSGEVIEEEDETNNVGVSAPIQIDGNNPCVDDLEVFEPNNTIGDASPLVSESQTHLGLGVCPDLDDWYKIDLAEGDRITATITYDYKSSKGFLYIQLIDPNGIAVLDEGTKSKSTDVELPWTWDPGTYYLRVYNPKKSKWKPYLYDLDIVIADGDTADQCATDQYETNNDYAHAAGVGCGLKQMTMCRKDKDWLTFDLPAETTVDLTLSNEGSKLRLLVYANPEAKELLKLTGNGSTSVTSGDAPATYWIKVEPKTTNTKVTNFDYTIFFDGIAGVDLQVLTVEPVAGEAYQGEDDIVGFEIINQCLDTVETVNFGVYMSQADELDENAVLVHEAPVGATLAGGESLLVQEKFTVPFDTPPGDYNLYVMADHDEQVEESNEGNNDHSAPYKILKICVDDGQEPNPLPILAPELTPGLYDGLQVCPYDLDWYSIALIAGETITATAYFINETGDLDLRLYSAENFNKPIVKAFQTNDGEELKFKAETTASYFLRVNGLSGASNSYDLQIATAIDCGLVETCNDGDGCCNADCNANNDNDCAPECGNGELESGEVCDGDCPTECTTEDACGIATLTGEGCLTECVITQIDVCEADGCCADGCNANNDDDCAPVCGNDVPETGELCDGDCPTECIPTETCKAGELTGELCGVECVYTDIVECVSGDGCCPATCGDQDDSDCPSGG